MPWWQRIGLTLLAMVAASFLAGLAWQSVFTMNLPSYLGGAVGGLAAIPVWEFLKRIGPRRS
jgi:uncharacterized YccA/Bax inhibitor family protein